MYKKKKKEEGIILIEAIIAVGVLATMFAAAMALFTTSVTGVRISSDQLIAIFLAQDAIEQVVAKNTYNTDNFVEPWLDGLGNCISTGGGSVCEVHYYAGALITSDAGSCGGSGCSIYYNPGTGEYSSASGGGFSVTTNYRRQIRITRNPADNHEAFLDVTVTWPDGPSTMSYTLHHILYDPTPLY